MAFGAGVAVKTFTVAECPDEDPAHPDPRSMMRRMH
jgi:hypothetical protein